MGADRTVAVNLIARVQGLIGPIRTSIVAAKELGAEVDKLSTEKLGKLTKLSTTVGVGLVGAFLLATKVAADFEKQMSAVYSVSKANQTQQTALRNAAIKAGQDTAYTATEAAQAEEELAKAGISAADIIGGGLNGALTLASAGSLDLASAAKYAAQAMVEFGLHGKDVAHIADVLTSAANQSVSDVTGLGEALGQAGTVAHQAGMSLEETTGVLALFSQHGLDGAEAGTTFKQMLLKLEGPSGKAKDLMKAIGLNVYDANGQFKNAAELADSLQKSLGHMTNAQRNAALATIFGSRAVRGAIDLYNEGAKGVNDWTAKVSETGVAAKTANTKLNNLAGDTKKLEGSLQAMAITSSGGATTGLRFLAQGAERAVNTFSKMPAPLQSALSLIAGISGATLLAGTGFVKVKSSASNFMSTLTDMGPTGAKAATALGKIGSIAGKLGLAGLAAGVLYEGFKALGGWIDKQSAPVARNIDKLTESLKNLATGLGVSGELAATFGSDLGKLPTDIAKVSAANLKLATLNAKINSVGRHSPVGAGAGLRYLTYQRDQTASGTAQQNTDVKALDKSLTDMVTNGGVAQAQTALADLAQRQNLSADEWAKLLALLPNYEAASHAAALANTGLAHGFADAAAQNHILLGGLQQSIDAGQTMDDVWKALNGALVGTDKANLTANQSIENVTKTIKDNAKALAKSKDGWKGNSDAALADRIAIGDAAKAAADAADAKYQETGSIDAANKVYKTYIGNLRKTLMGLLHNKGLVDDLLAAYTKMPPLVSTTFDTPGLVTANDTATGYFNLLNQIPKTVHTKVSISGANKKFLTGVPNRWGNAYEPAADGLLSKAAVYSGAASGSRYGFAEPSTGGELFVPKNGDYARSVGLMNIGAGWYGQRLVPGIRGGSARGGEGAIAYNTTTNVYPQFAVLTPQELDHADRIREIRQRVGRPR